MKCTICGKPAILGGLCNDCYINREPLFVLPAKLEITQCSVCKRFLIRNKWVKLSQKKAIKKLIKDNIKFNIGDISMNIRIEEVRKNFLAVVDAFKKVGDKELHQEVEVKIKMKLVQCNICAQQSSQSFEAILQLRGESVKEVFDFVEKQVLKKENVRIVKFKKMKQGVDLYLNSSSFAVSTARKLVKRFGGILKFNKKLYSVNHLTSKEVYRTSVLFRVFPFNSGDVIKIENMDAIDLRKQGLNKRDDILKIIGADKLIKAVSLRTGHKVTLKYDEDIKFVRLKKEKVLVSQEVPFLEVLHPETYQPFRIKNDFMLKREVDEMGKKVKHVESYDVVLDDGLIYVV